VLPLLVVIGWIAGKPLSLLFDPLVAIILFLSIILVSNAIADGKSNYLEGEPAALARSYRRRRADKDFSRLDADERFRHRACPAASVPRAAAHSGCQIALASWFIPDAPADALFVSCGVCGRALACALACALPSPG